MKYKYFMLRCINLLLIAGLLAGYQSLIYFRKQNNAMANMKVQIKQVEAENQELYSIIKSYVDNLEGQREKMSAGEYTDGIYEGSGTGFGGEIQVSVLIEQQKIVSVDIVEAGGEDSAYLSMARGVIDSVIEEQSSKVDGVSGATYSSKGIKAAIEQALEEARGNGQE